MKIILHGATNGSNFGDYLFADMFLNRLSECNADGKNMFFEFPRYGIGRFFRSKLGYTTKHTLRDLFTSDILIYISGGYFGDTDSSLGGSIRRFIRYMPVGILFIIMKKPILILGVGGGPLSNKYLRKKVCLLMEKTLTLTVRDEETANYFRDYGVKREIVVTSDTAQAITLEGLPTLDETVKNDLEQTFRNRKILFLHVNGNDNADRRVLNTIVEPLNQFLHEHKDYGVIVGSCTKNGSLEYLEVSKNIKCDAIYYYNYHNPWQLCSLLNEVDFIITIKLHVGIIGATLSKPVVAFPTHKEKTPRYYRHIGESGRCIPLVDVTYKDVYEVINNYYDKPILLSDHFRKAANYNLNIMEDTISALKKVAKGLKL